MILCAILELGTFSITRFSPSSDNKNTTQSLMSSAAAAIFAFLFYLVSGVMLIYIPKLADADQLIKIDKFVVERRQHSTSRNTTTTSNHRNISNNFTDDVSEESQVQKRVHNKERTKRKTHINTHISDDENGIVVQNPVNEFSDEENLHSNNNIHHVHFNDEPQDYPEVDIKDELNKKKRAHQKYGNNKQAEIEIPHGISGISNKNLTDGSSTNSIFHYSVPDESNTSDSFHYKVPLEESSKNILLSDCGSGSERNNKNNPRQSNNNIKSESVYSGVSALTDDFEHKKRRIPYSTKIDDIDLSISHVLAQDPSPSGSSSRVKFNRDVNFSRQIPPSLRENTTDNIGVGETIFVIGDTMVI